MTIFESLINDFAKATGLKIEIDEGNSCALETDGLIVVIQYRQKRDDLVIFAPVTDPDRVSLLSKELLTRALALSFNGEETGGNYLGLSEGSLILSRVVPIENLDHNKLATILLSFSESALYVRDRLSDSSQDFTDENLSDESVFQSLEENHALSV